MSKSEFALVVAHSFDHGMVLVDSPSDGVGADLLRLSSGIIIRNLAQSLSFILLSLHLSKNVVLVNRHFDGSSSLIEIRSEGERNSFRILCVKGIKNRFREGVEVLLFKIGDSGLRIEVGCEALHLDLLLLDFESKHEVINDLNLSCALEVDLSLGSEETIVNWVGEVNGDFSLDRDVAKVTVELGGVDFINLCADLDLA